MAAGSDNGMDPSSAGRRRRPVEHSGFDGRRRRPIGHSGIAGRLLVLPGLLSSGPYRQAPYHE
ncbi:hypothetical protein, partial [Streptomyces spinoverrucosus]|uniref:hypothetical protein n=1 Tax=Streptomyces spinoverrucosus TaxID=284043 RepID=UPI001C3FBED9